MKEKLKLLFILIALANHSFAQSIDHWESVIRSGDNCKYLIPSSDIGKEWITPAFNDNSWITAPSGIGYGDDDDRTEIPAQTQAVYIRHFFTIKTLAEVEALVLDMDYDDGFIAYLNGTEIARANITDPVSWNMTLSGTHEAALYRGENPDRFIINRFKSILKEGENFLAVEVHNQSATSSDLSSNIFLHVGLSTSERSYNYPPLWFWEPKPVTASGLPLMIINTNGQTIPDEPRIVADMGLIYNGKGETNSEFDEWNEYEGKISIEIRGETSSNFPKKSYSIELQNNDGSNNNQSLLGLPKENDFVLYGPYSDKTLMKNVLTYGLYEKTGHWAPRTRYIEVFVNGEYRGVYVLAEKIKRDKNRVAIDKLTAKDTSAMDISGGYILRRDKTNKLDPSEYWASPVNQIYFEPLVYQYFDPEIKDLTSKQADYIKGWMKGFDEMMSGVLFKNPGLGYRQYINVYSFIDMMFINEISKGVDNYMFSTYFYKENDSDGGRLVAGPPWDYNLSYGNLNYGHNASIPYTYGWVYTNWSRVYWYNRLMEDPWYQNQVYCRWGKFRETIFSDENIEYMIDSCVAVLGGAVDRNFEKFPILGKYVWANSYYPDTYGEEIAFLKKWLLDRLAWMDRQWLNQGKCPEALPEGFALDNHSVYENEPSGVLIGSFNAIDPEVYRNSRFYLASGIGDTDNDQFSIRGNVLRAETIFDYEKRAQYSIRVGLVDSNEDSLEQVFEIYILERENEEPINNPNALSFFIAPNPTSDFIQIIDHEDEFHFYKVILVDLAGKQLGNYSGHLEDINMKLKEDVNALKSGIYITRIESEETFKTFKFIKQ